MGRLVDPIPKDYKEPHWGKSMYIIFITIIIMVLLGFLGSLIK